MNHFKGKQFQQDVIIVAVGYYLRYNLSYREVQEILYDRGINVSHTTIYRWVQEYGKLLYQIWKKKNKKSFYSWKMDETYIKIKIRKKPCFTRVFKGFSALFFAPLKIHLRRHKKDPNGSISFKIYLGSLQPEAEGSLAPDT